MGRKKAKYGYGIVGKTTDGKFVMSGAYWFCSTYGYPLAELLYDCKEHNMVIDWINYYDNALELGMKSDRVIKRVQEAVLEVHGHKYCEAVMDRLAFHINQREQ